MDPIDAGGDGERFSELDELEAELRRRHHKLVAGVLAGSVALIAVGGFCLWLAQTEDGLAYVAGGLFCVGLGALGIVRGLMSALTDIDTRDRGEWDTVVGNEDRIQPKEAE